MQGHPHHYSGKANRTLSAHQHNDSQCGTVLQNLLCKLALQNRYCLNQGFLNLCSKWLPTAVIPLRTWAGRHSFMKHLMRNTRSSGRNGGTVVLRATLCYELWQRTKCQSSHHVNSSDARRVLPRQTMKHFQQMRDSEKLR